MSYSQALEQQIRWHRWLKTTLESAAREPGQNERNKRFKFAERAVREGDTYYWSPDICNTIMQVSTGLPKTWQFDSPMLPTRSGFAWFAGGLRFRNSAIHHPHSITIEAMCWSSGLREADMTPAVSVGMFINMTDQPGSTQFATILLVQGESIEQTIIATTQQADKSGPELLAAVTGLVAFATCLTFLEQRILDASQQPVERHFRRRMERAGYEREPLVRVVELRRKQAKSEHAGEHEAVDWSHQWIVSGHWRQQWHPSLNAHQPRWIMPYVKGPEDKPLKAPRARVFAVVR